MCNYLDADIDQNSLFEFFLDHQLEKHGTIDTDYIRIFRIFLPHSTWKKARGNPEFWEAWRNRNKTPFLLKRLKR